MLRVIGKTSTSVVERVDEEKRSGTSSLKVVSDRCRVRGAESTYTTRGQVTHHPLGVAIPLFLEGEHRLVRITESEVEGLGREVSNDVRRVTSPQRQDTLVLGGSAEALADTIVLAIETTGLQHLILNVRNKSAGPCALQPRRNVATREQPFVFSRAGEEYALLIGCFRRFMSQMKVHT